MEHDSGEKPPRLRNIAELARLAGVSAGTVSRALANKDLVNSQTRERIQAIAREHGFRPNQMASRLRTGHTGVVGVVKAPSGRERSHADDPLFMALLGHLADTLTDRGYDLMFSSGPTAGEEDWLDRVADSGMLDGVLVLGQPLPGEASGALATIERVANRYPALVVWGNRREGAFHCSVGTDDPAAGQLALERLQERGCRSIAFVAAPDDAQAMERLAGAQAAADRVGLALTVRLLAKDGDDGPAGVHDLVAQLDGQVDGIIAATDPMAAAVLAALQQQGKRVPEDVAVVGFGDMPVAAQTSPPLTTVSQNLAEAAEMMVDALLARLGGAEHGSAMVPPRLVVRQSA